MLQDAEEADVLSVQKPVHDYCKALLKPLSHQGHTECVVKRHCVDRQPVARLHRSSDRMVEEKL